MTNRDELLTIALDAFSTYFDALAPADPLTAAEMLANLDTPATITAADPANADDDDYANIFQITLNYDDCPTDILMINPLDPTYFISIDSDAYRPMI